MITVTDPNRGPEPYPTRPPARPKLDFQPGPIARAARRPATVTTASVLWWVAAALGFVGAAWALLNLDEFRSAVLVIIARTAPDATQAAQDRVVTSTTVILIGSAILIALLQAIFAAGLRSGRGGARAALILLTVLAALHLLFAVHVLSPVSRIVQLLGLAVAAAATVAMLLPGTYAWFARPRR